MAGDNQGNIVASYATGAVRGNDQVGTLVGNNRGSIFNSYANGVVNGRNSVGGLAGDSGGVIVNSYSDVSVSASGTHGGGLLGRCAEGCSIRNSFVLGRVSGVGNSADYIGGLVGYIDTTNNTDTNIQNNYVWGDVGGGTNNNPFYARVGVAGARLRISNNYVIGRGSLPFSIATASLGTVTGSANYYNLDNMPDPSQSAQRNALNNLRSSLQLASHTAQQLRSGAGGIYTQWIASDWDFGTNEQYPVLRYTQSSNTQIARVCNGNGLPNCGDLIAPQIRYGLQDLSLESSSMNPPFSEGSSRYFGEVHSNPIRLIPTAKLPNATINIYLGSAVIPSQSIASGHTSAPIFLNEDGITRIQLEVANSTGTSIRYGLYMRYQDAAESADRDGDGFTEIYYLEQLAEIGSATTTLAGKYELVRDLDFNDPNSYASGQINPAWTSGVGWNRIGGNIIGENTVAFTGEFDGNGNTIANLYVRRDFAGGLGLFGVIRGGTVRNLGLLDLSLTAASGGGMTGTCDNCTISNSFVTGIVSARTQVGGLAGTVQNNGTIVNSISGATITQTFGFALRDRAGGLIGECTSCTILNSFAFGLVDADINATNLGGFAGRVSGNFNISNNHASGDVRGGGQRISPTNGGFVGSMEVDTGSRLNANYSIGTTLGGFDSNNSAGLDFVAAPTISAPNYWNQDTARAQGQHFDSRLATNIRGRTTQQLQEPIEATGIFEDWSSEDWDFGSSAQYPILKYTDATNAVSSPQCRTESGAMGRLPLCNSPITPETRYGLRELTTTDYPQLSPPFDVQIQNLRGFYSGVVEKETPQMELIATTVEADATYSVYVNNVLLHADIASSSPSGIITLIDGSNELAVQVNGARTVVYPLYLDYRRITEADIIDTDHDGLVEISDVEDLAMINDNTLAGVIGYRTESGGTLNTSGCPNNTCRGYELTRSLDLLDPDSYRNPAARDPFDDPTADDNFHDPIRLIGDFDGNGHTVSNVIFNDLFEGYGAVGFFRTATDSHINGLGILGLNIDYVNGNNTYTGGMFAQCIRCRLSNSYVVGSIRSRDSETSLGTPSGLVGFVQGDAIITNSYFLGTIDATNHVGGLVGGRFGSAVQIENSRVIGRIITQPRQVNLSTRLNQPGMFVYEGTAQMQLTNSLASVLMTNDDQPRGDIVLPTNAATIQGSYFDRDIALVDEPALYARSTADLQGPTSAMGIYQGWDSDDWDFGGNKQYPAIKYNAESCQDDLPQRNELCGKLLPYQGGLMKNFKPLNGGLNRPFDSAIFDYEIQVDIRQQSLRFAAEAFNSDAAIVVYIDGSEVTRVMADATTPPITLDTAGKTLVDVIVEERDRSSYRYRFDVSRFDTITNLDAIDHDDDGLIDVATREQLNAMRYSPDGSSYRESAGGTRFYCRVGCRGYELTADIDMAGIFWDEIENFNTHFKGNGYKIANLVNEFFRVLGVNAKIENIHLIDPTGVRSPIAVRNLGIIFNSWVENADINLGSSGGAFVGQNRGIIINSGVIGGNVAIQSDRSVRELSGFAHINTDPGNSPVTTRIQGSFSTISISTRSEEPISVAGLVAIVDPKTFVSGSYTRNAVLGMERFGGLSYRNNAVISNSYTISGPIATTRTEVDGNPGTVQNSYWNSETAMPGVASEGGTAVTTAGLQMPTSASGIYRNWNPRHWHFGTAEQYPVVRYQGESLDLCRTPTAAELRCPTSLVPASLPAADREIVCLDRLSTDQEVSPYCGALVPYQDRIGLIGLELSASGGVQMQPQFSPEVEYYTLSTNSSNQPPASFRVRPTAYYRSSTVTLVIGNTEQVIPDNTFSPNISVDNTERVTLKVYSANTNQPRSYTIDLRAGTIAEDVDLQIEALDNLQLVPSLIKIPAIIACSYIPIPAK